MNARCWTRFEPVPLTSGLNQTREGSPPTSSLFFFPKISPCLHLTSPPRLLCIIAVDSTDDRHYTRIRLHERYILLTRRSIAYNPNDTLVQSITYGQSVELRRTLAEHPRTKVGWTCFVRPSASRVGL
jgi:hypothetical protein